VFLLVSEAMMNSYSIFASVFSSGEQVIDLSDIKFDDRQVKPFETTYDHPTQIEISVSEPFLT
jgi:hypothetical protein